MMRIPKIQSGFAMPTVIFMIVIMSSVAYAALMQSNNVLNLSYKQAYIQMSRVAAKAGVNYAKEQFDSNANYSGTTETTLVSNSRYRLTFKVEVLSTSPDGLEKSIKGTGSIYIPELSTTARYVFDVRAEIVRTYAVSRQPSDFGNLALWLDSSKLSSLYATTTATTSLSPIPTTTFGSSGNGSRDTVEELETDGSQTSASWQSQDLELSYCDSAEFNSSTCNSSTTRKQFVGLVFQNISIPKNATIVSANIEMVGGTPSGTAGSVTHRYYGLYKTSTNPSLDLFTSNGSNQVRTKINTSNLHTTAYIDDTSNNFPPGNNRQVGVTSIVQEMVNNPNWASGNNMGFGIKWQSGSGVRRALKDGLKLNISYTSTTTRQASNGQVIVRWDDARANGLSAFSTHGNQPTRVDNQINSLPVVRFNNGNMLSTLSSALTGNEFTVIAVVKSNFATSSSSGRIVSGMNSGQSSDSVNGYSIQGLRRNGSSSGFGNQYDSTTSHGVTFNCSGSSCDNTAVALSAVFDKKSDNTVISTIRKNATTQAFNSPSFSVTPSNLSYNLDQLWIGGRRSGSGTGSGIDYFNGDYAEIAVYNTRLSCSQIVGIEEYLRAKWALAASGWDNSTCPPDNVPVL